MKKVLFIDTGLEFGGGTKSFLYLLDGLAAQNEYEILVFFENDYLVGKEKISSIINKKGAKFINFRAKEELGKLKKEMLRLFGKERVAKSNYQNDLKYAKELLDEIKPDFIHLNNHFSTNLAYNAAANELGIKVLQHCRKNSQIEKFKLEILKGLKFKCICVSNATYEFYSKSLKIERNVVYNPVTTNEEIYDKREREIISIVMPANFLSLKGHDIVFDAFACLKRDDLRLNLAGSGEFSRETFDKFKRLENSGIIKNLGFVKDMSEIYAKSDFVLGFSSDEGLPRVVIEGLANGCGIIFSDIKVIRELYEISSKKEIFHIVKRDWQSLLACLEELKKPSVKQKDEAIITEFSLQRYVSQIKQIYDEI